jgi:hypothetical protein
MRYEEPGGRQSPYAKEREQDPAYTLAHAPVLFLQARGSACTAVSVAAQSKPSFGDQNICFFASSRLSLLYNIVPESITFGMLFAADLFSITDTSFSTATLPIFCGN